MNSAAAVIGSVGNAWNQTHLLWGARCAGFCVRGTDVSGRDQVLLCEIMCIHDVGSLTLPLLCGVRLHVSTGEDLSVWHPVCTGGPCFFVDMGIYLLYRGGE